MVRVCIEQESEDMMGARPRHQSKEGIGKRAGSGMEVRNRKRLGQNEARNEDSDGTEKKGK